MHWYGPFKKKERIMNLKIIFYLLFVSQIGYALIRVDIGLIRNGISNFNLPISIEKKNVPVQVFKDEQAYVEAELIEEAADHYVIKFIIATKCETGAYLVRGMPRLSFPTKDLLAMGSINCDSAAERFILVAAAAKIN